MSRPGSSTERNPARVGRFEWQQVAWAEAPVMTRGSWGGLPALGWGWVDPSVLATRRQLAAQGLRPGGQDPAAVLLFGHTDQYRRRADHAYLYQVASALPKREATPAQREAIEKALAARRTCRDCGDEQDYYLSTVSRMCGDCEEASDFWGHYCEQRFGPGDHTTRQPATATATATEAGSRRPVDAVARAAAAVAELRQHRLAGPPAVAGLSPAATTVQHDNNEHAAVCGEADLEVA